MDPRILESLLPSDPLRSSISGRVDKPRTHAVALRGKAEAKRGREAGPTWSCGLRNRRTRSGRHPQGPEPLERQMTVMLFQKPQEPFVIVSRHVEEAQQQAIAAVRLLEAGPDDVAHVVACDVPRHEGRIRRGPERFLVNQDALEDAVHAR